MTVATEAELAAAKRLVRTIGAIDILIVQTATRIVAMRNNCTHLGKPLHGGRLIAGQIHCPFHGACFDLITGRALSGPAVAPLQMFAVTVTAGKVQIALPGDDH